MSAWTDTLSDIDRKIEPHREVVVVTGASTGIGTATARELSRRGFHVLAVRRFVLRVGRQEDDENARANRIMRENGAHDVLLPTVTLLLVPDIRVAHADCD